MGFHVNCVLENDYFAHITSDPINFNFSQQLWIICHPTLRSSTLGDKSFSKYYKIII